MNRKQSALILALSVTCPVLAAQAQGTSNIYTPSYYWGLGLGKSSTELNSGGQDFDLTQFNGAFGYQFHPNMAVELWASITLDPETDFYTSDLIDTKVEVSSNSVGAFLAARAGEQVYGIGRVGLVSTSFTYSSSGFEDEEERELGLGFGFGVGFKPVSDDFSIEFNYTVLPDVDDPIFTAESYSNSVMAVDFKFYF